jgi:PAS domain S-box-containing protein
MGEVREASGAGARGQHGEASSNGRYGAMLRALRAVMQIIVREKDPDRLLAEVGDALTRTRGYRDAWLARVDAQGRLGPGFPAGTGGTLAPLVTRMAAGDAPSCVREALASPTLVVRVGPHELCDCPSRGEGHDWAVLAAALRHHERTLGVMCVTLPAAAAADPEEAESLGDVAAAVALALHDLAEGRQSSAVLDQLADLSLAIEQVSVMVAITDTAARIQYVNPKFTEVTGYTLEEIRGIPGTDLGAPPAEEAARMWAQLREGKQWRGEMLKRRKDGSTYWESATISAIRDRNGALEALRASEEKYRTLVEAASDAIFIADAESGIILEVNSKAEALTGRPREELVGLHQGELHPPDERDRYLGIFHEHASLVDEAGRAVDVGVLHADGRIIPVEITGTSVEIGGRRIVHGVFRDLTERRRLEQQLRQAEKMQAIGQLAGGIAHDFNNRLVAILGFAELLARQVPEGSSRRYAERIVRNARRAANLTGQLLAFARKGNFQVAPVDLHAAVREVLLFLTHGIDKRITLRMQLTAPRPVTLGDPAQLENALLNLALNARDAMPAGGTITFRTANVILEEDQRARLGLEPSPEGFISVAVSDTGHGMDEHVRAHLFEPFFTTKKMGEGSGMGLAAVYGTVQSHRGAVEVESAVGKGTTFTLYLPLVAPEQPAVEPAPASTRPRHARVLVVDDESDVRELVRDMLASLGCEVMACRDGLEAAMLYAREWQTFDLVILDMVMPRLGGRATLARLREVNPQVKAILMTGHGPEGEAADILNDGAVAFVQKPFAMRELAEQVDAALAK